MNNIVLQKTWVQGRPVVVDNLLGTAFTGEAGAHTFKIMGVDAAQETVTISGTITGKLLAANNVTISLSGSIEDGCAVVTLTDECYDVPGRFIFSVYATSGSTTLCLYCAVGNVLRTDSQVIAYPTESLPNITSLMADLEQILADWPADYSQLQSDVSSLKSAVTDLNVNNLTSGPSEWLDDQFIRHTNGQGSVVPATWGVEASGWVEVEQNTVIVLLDHFVLPDAPSIGMAFYNANYQYISGVGYVANQPAYGVVPENAKFLRYTISTEKKDTYGIYALKMPEYFVKSADYTVGEMYAPGTTPQLNSNVSVYNDGVLTVQLVRIADNSGFPSQAGLLLTFAKSTAYSMQMFISVVDETGIWYRYYNVDGTPREFRRLVNDLYYQYNLPKNIVAKSVMAKRQPLVSFIDDDGAEAAYTRFKPLAETYNIPFCCAVITSLVGQTDAHGDAHMTWEQMLELQNDYGFEFLSHTHDHIRLDGTYTYAVKQEQAYKSFNALLKHGLKVRGLCYPQGLSDYGGREAVSKFYDFACMGSAPNNEIRINTGCVPSYYITRCDLGVYGDHETEEYPDTLSLDYYKTVVDQAIANNGWAIFTTHAWDERFDATQFGYLEQLIQYCQTKGVAIVTASTAFDMFGNQNQIGDYLGYWNLEGYAQNKICEESFPRYLQSQISGSTPITFFPYESTTQHLVQSAYSSTFPTLNGGVLETHRFRKGNDIYGYQYWYPTMTDDYYRRRANDDGTWNAWEMVAVARDLYVGSGQQFTKLKDAVDYINTKSLKNATIHVKPGNYDLVTEYGQTYLDGLDISSNQYVGLRIGNNTHIIFDEGAYVTFAYNGSNADVAEYFSAFNVMGSCTIENANIYVKNARYCVHEDLPAGSATIAPYTVKYINCTMQHAGNTIGEYDGTVCIGAGTMPNSLSIIEGGKYICGTQLPWAISYHNFSKTGYGNYPSRIIMKNVWMNNGLRLYAFRDSIVNVVVTGCKMPNGFDTYDSTYFNVTEWNNTIG